MREEGGEGGGGSGPHGTTLQGVCGKHQNASKCTTILLENVEHCGGKPEHAGIGTVLYHVTHQVKDPPTCTSITETVLGVEINV